jgi:glucan biosynthesis protein C
LERHFVIMTQASSHQRLHDLDALRAAAMLIGIVYHAALSFAADFPWMVHDVSQAQWAYVG